MNAIAKVVAFLVLSLSVVGCATGPRQISLDAEHPSVSVTSLGVRFGDKYIEPREVPSILKRYDVPTSRTVHVLVENDAIRDLSTARQVLGYLRVAGYTRNVLVTEKHGESENLGERPARPPAARAPRIRYKGSNE